VFAPKPRDYGYKIPKKVKRLALKSALSAKVRDGESSVVEGLSCGEPKTKEMVAFLAGVNAEKKALIVTDGKDENVVRSASNIPGVETTHTGSLNVYDILNHISFIVTKDAVRKIEEVYS
jgi:large subunit ribosomal protein L4